MRWTDLGIEKVFTLFMTVAKARKKFARGLVGTWSIDDMLVGMRLTFREDGSRKMDEWGWDHSHMDPEYVSVPKFQWRAVADHTIEITHRGETRTVRYDFMICKNVYDIAELRVFEAGLKPDERGEIGFWLSPDSLVYEKPAPSGGWASLWKEADRLI